ncbi:GDP-mannose 4,6-dehydratase [Fibrobacter sp. UWP2]|uniref:GDP-mannose 4,6-dehydratase n=1 Tax=Fibrobacter sp. UWP2 TaxID=1896216 RepID=UPI0009155143|nr:GDP-mannose 4,6-dehydratase [Fibrobacter sp. UWP2]SHI77812.1 GDP-4-dehydro-6-deoxy-D-mannose reductase [Fibrobacter sp. UWP2]
MKTVIIGAKGFVGKYLVQELEGAGHTVVPVDLPEVDLLNAEQVDALIEGARPDAVVNLAAISSVGASWKNPSGTISVNVNGTLNLLEAIRKYVPQAKALLIGSAEEYAIPEGQKALKETDPLEASNPYGISKIAQENFAQLYRKKYRMKIVCTRSFNHTGVGQTTTFALPSFVKQVAAIDKSGKPGKIFVGNLSAYRDFSDVEDVVHVYRMLLENENEFDTYNVGSGVSNKIEDLLKNVILKLTPVQIEIVVDPEKVRPVETPYLCADNSRVKKYWNGTDIRITLKKMFDHFRAEA